MFICVYEMNGRIQRKLKDWKKKLFYGNILSDA